MQKNLDTMAANAAMTAQTLQDARELNDASSAYATAAKQLKDRVQSQKKGKGLFGLF